MVAYSTFEIDKPHCHNQNLVGTFHGTSLLWSTKMKQLYSGRQIWIEGLRSDSLMLGLLPMTQFVSLAGIFFC